MWGSEQRSLGERTPPPNGKGDKADIARTRIQGMVATFELRISGASSHMVLGPVQMFHVLQSVLLLVELLNAHPTALSLRGYIHSLIES